MQASAIATQLYTPKPESASASIQARARTLLTTSPELLARRAATYGVMSALPAALTWALTVTGWPRLTLMPDWTFAALSQPQT